MEKTQSDTAAEINVYYDFRSPYAYFAARRMCGAEFHLSRPVNWRWRPVSINMLLNLQAGREPLAPYVDPLSPPKRRHLVADVTRLALFYKAPLRPPQPARPDPTLALCIATLLDDDGTPHDAFRAAVFRALWEEQRDVADKATMASCLGSLPIDLIERATAPTAQARLIANSVAAYQRGVFGVPSFVAGEEVFFGADRLDLLVAGMGLS